MYCGVCSVLSHCQVQRIAAVLYQCYSDVLQPDSLTMQTYRAAVSAVLKVSVSVRILCVSPLLVSRDSVSVSRLQLDQNPSADVLQKITRVSELQSNLYT